MRVSEVIGRHGMNRFTSVELSPFMIVEIEIIVAPNDIHLK